jgi:hypothetical protein
MPAKKTSPGVAIPERMNGNCHWRGVPQPVRLDERRRRYQRWAKDSINNAYVRAYLIEADGV